MISRLLLICCEGKTEKEYFDILRYRVYRIPGYIRISIVDRVGQHKALIDRTVEHRKALATEEGLSERDIECWAVCDDDGMSIPFADLRRYSERQGVNLAFSRPQFESYLLQHFEQSKEVRQSVLYGKLGNHKKQRGFGESYEKADLDWLENVLVDEPKLIDVAITNSDLRRMQSASLFLTVQDLTKRLKGLQRD